MRPGDNDFLWLFKNFNEKVADTSFTFERT